MHTYTYIQIFTHRYIHIYTYTHTYINIPMINPSNALQTIVTLPTIKDMLATATATVIVNNEQRDEIRVAIQSWL